MTIEELEYGAPAGASRGGGGYDRTPPQDLDAERSVLGGMMISKDAIADVVEQIRGTDFYRPAHEVVYDAILDLYGRGEPADAITVADELTKRGEIGRIGGAPYLHTLISSVPTAANAGYYARIVRERSVLRKLVEAGTRIVQLGYGTDGGDVDEIVNNAQAEVYAVTERRSSEDYLILGDIIGGTVDEIEAAGHRGEGMIGVPTGFSDLDRLTNGLHPGQMIVLAARPAIGKSTMGIDIVRSASIKHGMTSRRLLARDEPQRDHHASAVGRGARAPAEAAQRPDGRGRLGQDRRDHGQDLRGAAVHRRLPEHVADGDPRQVPPPQAAPRPQARGHRLPAADVVAASASSPASRRSRSSPVRSSCWPRSSRSRSSRSAS